MPQIFAVEIQWSSLHEQYLRGTLLSNVLTEGQDLDAVMLWDEDTKPKSRAIF